MGSHEAISLGTMYTFYIPYYSVQCSCCMCPTPPTTPILGPTLGGSGIVHDKGMMKGNGNEGHRFTNKLLMPLPMPMPMFGIQVAPSSSSSGRTIVSSFLKKWWLIIFSFKIRCSTYHHRNLRTSPRLKRFPSLKGWGEAPLARMCIWTWSVDAHSCKTGSYKEDKQHWKIYK
jgi:hypothetical protein